jgi:type IV pilus assembly protein PilB
MKNNLDFFKFLKSKGAVDLNNSSQIDNLIEKDKAFDLDVFLLKNNILEHEKLTQLKSDFYKIPYKSLIDRDILKSNLNLISEKLAKNYNAICFDYNGKVMSVGIVDPDLKAMEAINFLGKQRGVEIDYFIISRESFNYAFKRYREMEEEITSALEVKSKETGEDFLQLKKEAEELDALDVDDPDSAPVAKIVSVIIKNAIDGRASDIHIEPYENESRVRYRIDGILKNTLSLPRKIHNAVIARVKVLAKMKLDETRVPQDGRIVLIFDGREVDFRISTFPVGNGQEKIVLRILDTARGIISLKELGFNSCVMDIFERNIKKTNGIILATGPTGSGKTTTLYSIINVLNKEGINISTLEDPIEYQIKGVNQSQVRPKIGYSFATGIRSLVRQDPDIIMVGEIRDEETAELSVHAGLTGHLVLSTLHTNDAIGTIFRLADMKVDPVLLASILRMVIAQRLARRLCDHCKEELSGPDREEVLKEMKLSLSELKEERLRKEIEEVQSLDDIDNLKIYKPVGCSRCQDTGYLDRIAVGEGIEINNSLKRMIVNDINNLDQSKVRESQEFISIKQDGFLKVLNGITNFEEIIRIIES